MPEPKKKEIVNVTVGSPQDIQRSGNPWKRRRGGQEPIKKEEPVQKIEIVRLARREIDALVRQAGSDDGLKAIIKVIREGGNINAKDIEELAVAVMGSKKYAEGAGWKCTLLGVLSPNLPVRPDLMEVARRTATSLEADLQVGWCLSYSNTEDIFTGANALSRPELLDALLENMKRVRYWIGESSKKLKDSSAKNNDFEIRHKKRHEESWDEMARASLNNGAPAGIIYHIAKIGCPKFAIPCIHAANELGNDTVQGVLNILQNALKENPMEKVSKEEMELMREVEDGNRMNFIWNRMHSAFCKMLRSEEKMILKAREALPFVRPERMPPFAKAALESSAVPIDEAIAALVSVPESQEKEELWKIALVEFASAAKSGNSRDVKSAKDALKLIPPEKQEQLGAEAGWEVKHEKIPPPAAINDALDIEINPDEVAVEPGVGKEGKAGGRWQWLRKWFE
ncbi:MAG: hypothetical protein NTX79_06995 [Candidatus Micrarchaeota archaeon]|nr:hypothetical protein [Candidatus Micrarchaeota archaeon]